MKFSPYFSALAMGVGISILATGTLSAQDQLDRIERINQERQAAMAAELDQVRAQAAKLEQELASAKLKFGDQHPQVVELLARREALAQIGQLERAQQAEQDRRAVVAAEAARLRDHMMVLERKLATARTQLSDDHPEVAKLRAELEELAKKNRAVARVQRSHRQRHAELAELVGRALNGARKLAKSDDDLDDVVKALEAAMEKLKRRTVRSRLVNDRLIREQDELRRELERRLKEDQLAARQAADQRVQAAEQRAQAEMAARDAAVEMQRLKDEMAQQQAEVAEAMAQIDKARQLQQAEMARRAADLAAQREAEMKRMQAEIERAEMQRAKAVAELMAAERAAVEKKRSDSKNAPSGRRDNRMDRFEKRLERMERQLAEMAEMLKKVVK